jgi:hypothetical protein
MDWPEVTTPLTSTNSPSEVMKEIIGKSLGV